MRSSTWRSAATSSSAASPTRAVESETAALADRILAQERHAASAVKALFPEAAALALQHTA
jgi:hypothetical protein